MTLQFVEQRNFVDEKNILWKLNKYFAWGRLWKNKVLQIGSEINNLSG